MGKREREQVEREETGNEREREKRSGERREGPVEAGRSVLGRRRRSMIDYQRAGEVVVVAAWLGEGERDHE